MSCLLFVNIGYGVTGLFLGNIIGMALRICLTWTLEIKNHIQLWAFWLRVKPPTGYAILTIFLFVLGHKEMNLLHRKSMGPVLTFLIGGALFVVNLLPIAYDNRHTILKMVRDRIAKEKSV